MTPIRDPLTREACCLPGDITVTKIHTGYMIGQALEQQGPGPWWTYVAMTATFDEARRMATDLAKRAGSHAWLHKSHDEYDPISVDDPLPSAETGAAPAR